MRANISYMLKNWIAWDKKSPVYFLIRVPALVFQPIVTAYIPKAMIDCIEKGVTVGRLTLVVGLLSLLVVLTTWLAPFMQELLNGAHASFVCGMPCLRLKKICIPIIQILKAAAAEKRTKGQWSSTAAIIPVRQIFWMPVISFAFVLWALFRRFF